jgi:hypothetical protein
MVRSEECWNLAALPVLADNRGARLARAWRRLGNGTYNLFECIAKSVPAPFHDSSGPKSRLA